MVWDPSSEIFSIPIIDHPVTWYGLLFALGFALGYMLLIRLVTPKLGGEKAKKLIESFALYAIIGVVLGARLAHILFYEPIMLYLKAPHRILMTWEGGLASHGGVVGLLIASWAFCKKHKDISLFELFNAMALPSMILAGFIRFGNFMNQEILGTPTSLPWGIVFGHPADETMPARLHPVQLYEMLLYWGIFLLLWPQRHKLQNRLCGFVLLFAFSGRAILEIFKVEKTGLFLSIPMILCGLVLASPKIAEALSLKRRERQQ